MRTICLCSASTYSANGLKVGRGLVLEVVGVGDLARSPRALVIRVVDQRSGPLALVGGVLLHGRRPRATARNLVTLGVGDSGGDEVTILLIIPVFGLLGLGVRNGRGLILQPILRLLSLLINNLVGSILVPVLRLLGLRVGNLSLVNPVLGLAVVGVVNLLRRVDGGGEVLEEGAVADRLAVDLDLEGLVGLDNEGVEGRGLGDTGRRGVLEVLLLILAGLGVLVLENEVNLEAMLELHSKSIVPMECREISGWSNWA